ncbi:hypothetical protein NMK54_12690 [Nocardia otitidiscaviarum]|uniref:DUF7373 family lipoprotein n=1 Tax=Nocardia otitidiscaviarum TaxID=1823 RepID=UPI001C8F5711|nr:hypothetical protein [Nocardia otitidiscaviarum]MCP9621013.1 hypothetical protein [Nocardia otitidiscaviarum]
MRLRYHRLAAVALAATAIVSAGCSDGSKDPARDFGPYPSERIDDDYDDRPSRARGILVESLRLGEHLVYADEIDSALTVGRGGGVIANHTGVVSMISGPQRSALSDYPVLGAFGAIAADRDYGGEQTETMLSISLIALPDEQTAAAAAAAMARADFETNADNVPVAVDAYPTALSHWRPGVPTIGSWLTWKSVVIRIYARMPEPNLERLVEMTTQAYRAQLAHLENFAPTPEAELPTLRLDPDNLLPRLVKTGDYIPDDRDFAVYSPRTFALLVGKPTEALAAYATHGITAIGVSHNKFLFRLADPARADEAVEYLASGDEQLEYVPMSGVSGLAGVTCYRAQQPSTMQKEARRFRCLIARGDAVARVFSNQESDVRQLAAAQYAALGDER